MAQYCETPAMSDRLPPTNAPPWIRTTAGRGDGALAGGSYTSRCSGIVAPVSSTTLVYWMPRKDWTDAIAYWADECSPVAGMVGCCRRTTVMYRLPSPQVTSPMPMSLHRLSTNAGSPFHCAQIAFVASISRACGSVVFGSSGADPTRSCTATAVSCAYEPAGDALTARAVHIACVWACAAASRTGDDARSGCPASPRASLMFCVCTT
jgi:hypothetical protein